MTDISTANSVQLQLVSDYTVMLRAIVGEWMRTMNKMNALNNSWNATVSAIIGTANNIPVTDNSNLAGTTKLTDTDIYAMTGYMQGCMTSYYDTSHQQIMTRACGAGNAT